jgi:hypothetical protein
MSDEPTSPVTPDAGQAADAPWSQGQAPAAPAPQDGQAQAPDGQDRGQAPLSTPATDEPSFFDPANLAPELLPAYKQMQAAFTTKTQDIARSKEKISAYDAFMRDPVGQMQNLARQYGLQVMPIGQQPAQQALPQDWQPQSWDEVLTRAKEQAKQELLQELQPVFGQMQQMRAVTVEQQLNSIDRDWRKYEGTMSDLLRQHPSLANDVSTLYRLAVPPEVLEAKAIQQALDKFDKKAQHLNVSQSSSAPRSKPGPPKVGSFQDAYLAAKKQIESGEA